MSATQTQISNILNLIVQQDARIMSYHFGQRWDIQRNVYNNFDPKVATGRMFPAVLLDVPDKVEGQQEPSYDANDEKTDMLIYFDTLQDYNNDGSANTLNLVEQWDVLKTIAQDFMANLVAVLGHYKLGAHIEGGVTYIQREMQHKDRLLTWEASFTLKTQTPCTEEQYKVDLQTLPATIPNEDIERTGAI